MVKILIIFLLQFVLLFISSLVVLYFNKDYDLLDYLEEDNLNCERIDEHTISCTEVNSNEN